MPRGSKSPSVRPARRRKAAHPGAKRRAGRVQSEKTPATTTHLLTQALLNASTERALLLDARGNILALNGEAARHLGGSVRDLTGRCIFRLWPPAVARRRRRVIANVRRTGKPLSFEDERDGRRLSASLYPVRSRRGRVTHVAVFARDVTESGKAAQALGESEKRFRELAELLPQTVCETDAKGKLTFVNRNSLRVFGYKPEDIRRGLNALDMLVPEDRRRAAENIRQVLGGKDLGGIEYTALTKDGTTFPVLVHTSRIIRNGNPAGLRGVLIDITGPKRTERQLLEYQEQLRCLALDLSHAEERERRRIAENLHEGVAQSLAMVRVKLDLVRRGPCAADMAGPLDEIGKTIDEAAAEMSTSIFDLSPRDLYGKGLKAAIRRLVEGLARQHSGIRFGFSAAGKPLPLGEDIRAFLYRATKEFIVNAIKHAHPQRVKVSIRRIGGSIRVEVANDGRAFKPVKKCGRGEGEGGFGLFSIRERLACLGGSLKISSAPHDLTRVVLQLSLAPRKERPAN